MKENSTIILFISLVIYFHTAYSLPEKQLEHEQQLSELAKQRCATEMIEGQDYALKVNANGSVEVSFFAKKSGSLKGNFSYSKKQWEGRQKVLAEQQANENINRRECIRSELKSLRETYNPPEVIKKTHLKTNTNNTNNTNNTGIDYGAYAFYTNNNILLSHGWATRKSSEKKAINIAKERCGHEKCQVLAVLKDKKCVSILGSIGSNGLGQFVDYNRQSSFNNACREARKQNKSCRNIKTICAWDKET